MSCDRTRAWMLDALLGELGKEAQAELRRHLEECESCRAESEAWAGVWRDLEIVAMEEPSEYGLDRLRSRIRHERQGPEPASEAEVSTPRRRVAWLPAAAAAVIALGLGLLLGWWAAAPPVETEPGAPLAEGYRYVMILTGTQETPELAERVRQEIGAWFRDLGERGLIEDFFGLDDADAVGAPPEGGLLADETAGLIIFRASSDEEARRIAASAPSLFYGGKVEVRRLD